MSRSGVSAARGRGVDCLAGEQAESNLDMANENLRLADESFKAGVCSSSDLMMAQTAWLQAEGEVLDARIEIEMTKLYLEQALGLK